jgi:hypothetical protein
MLGRCADRAGIQRLKSSHGLIAAFGSLGFICTDFQAFSAVLAFVYQFLCHEILRFLDSFLVMKDLDVFYCLVISTWVVCKIRDMH